MIMVPYIYIYALKHYCEDLYRTHEIRMAQCHMLLLIGKGIGKFKKSNQTLPRVFRLSSITHTLTHPSFLTHPHIHYNFFSPIN